MQFMGSKSRFYSLFLLQLCRLMLSAFINVCLISETSVAGLEIEQKPEQILRVNRVPSIDFMNNLIAGSFG